MQEVRSMNKYLAIVALALTSAGCLYPRPYYYRRPVAFVRPPVVVVPPPVPVVAPPMVVAPPPVIVR
jgi:hypothetical protein